MGLASKGVGPFCVISCPQKLRHCGRQEGRVAKDIEDVFTGRDEDGFTLTDIDAIDVSIAPQTDHDDERITMEVYLLSYLYDHAMYHEMRAVDEL